MYCASPLTTAIVLYACCAPHTFVFRPNQFVNKRFFYATKMALPSYVVRLVLAIYSIGYAYKKGSHTYTHTRELVSCK